MVPFYFLIRFKDFVSNHEHGRVKSAKVQQIKDQSDYGKKYRPKRATLKLKTVDGPKLFSSNRLTLARIASAPGVQ